MVPCEDFVLVCVYTAQILHTSHSGFQVMGEGNGISISKHFTLKCVSVFVRACFPSCGLPVNEAAVLLFCRFKSSCIFYLT